MPSKKNLTKLTRGLSILEQYVHPTESLIIHTTAEGLYLNTEKYDLIPNRDHQKLLERLGWERLARGYMWKNPGET